MNRRPFRPDRSNRPDQPERPGRPPRSRRSDTDPSRAEPSSPRPSSRGLPRLSARPRRSDRPPGAPAEGEAHPYDPSPSPSRAASIALAVLRQASHEIPADQTLRAELRKAGGVNAATARLAARMLFAAYRWRGWLEADGAPPSSALFHRALELQARFDREPESFSDDDLIARAIPDWTREAMEVSAAWIRSLQTEPVLWLRARPGQAADLAAALPGAEPGPESVPDALRYAGEEDLFKREEFHAGLFEIQDLASQIVSLLCAPQPGQTWWDACAGEGGKTLHLSALMTNKGLIWASDRADWRLTRLKRRAARAQAFNYRSAPWDGGAKLPTKTLFDGVLIDAPCSGIGTWQRNPHARWTTTARDVEELAALQWQLLDHAARSVKPGGRLIYSVCTLARAETSGVAARFAASHSEFQPEPFTAGPGLPAGPEVWLWPHEWQGNGMFIAQWRRR